MSAPLIGVILASTREGRQGERVARWFHRLASERDDLRAELVDLKAEALPLYDFAKPPSRGEYDDPRQAAWAETVAAADGYVIVTPEYNHGYPAPLKNALDLVYAEWNRKPVAFVSYGGGGGGLRGVQQLRLVCVELDMVPLRRQVFIPRVWSAFGDADAPQEDHYAKQAAGLLEDLAWWAQALRVARGS